MFRVAVVGLVECGRDHVLDGLGDRGRYPLVAGFRAGVRLAAGGRGGDLDDYMNYYKNRYRDEHHLACYDEDTIDRLNLAA